MENVGDVLTSHEAATIRQLAARANYLALGRPDTALSTKELCRGFAAPGKRSVQKLKVLVRYLTHHPRLIWKFRRKSHVRKSQHSSTLILQGATGPGGPHPVVP